MPRSDSSRVPGWVAVSVVPLVLVAGCVPDFVDDTTRVSSPRVVAIRATPPESEEGEPVTLEALVVAPVGSEPSVLSWSLCVDRKPLSELAPVSSRCLEGPAPGEEIAVPLGVDTQVTATVPEKACQLFGPERPDPKPGEPSGRPIDPDVTGGFYQPVLAWLGQQPVLGGVRLSCPLSGASPADTRDYNARYHLNTNPTPLVFSAVRADGSPDALSEPSAHLVKPGERLRLAVSLPACEPDAESCGGAETYVVYDALTQTVVTRTEAVVVSWYATDGTFDEPRSEPALRGADEPPAAQNSWVAPKTDGDVGLWAVVRDDRGGQAWIAGAVTVSP